VALRTAEKALFGPFRPPYSGHIHARSIAHTLFGQFLNGVLGSWTSALRSSPKFAEKVPKIEYMGDTLPISICWLMLRTF